MKKRLGMLLLALALCLSLAVPAFAAEGFADEYYRLYDEGELLTEEEEAALLEKLDVLSEKLRFDLVIITEKDLSGSTPREYADDLYDACKYGYGDGRDGALLLISMDQRDWYISTHGYGMTALTDYGIEYIGEQMKPDLSAGNYAAAFDTFLKLCGDFVGQARDGHPFDRGSEPKGPLSIVWLFLSIGVGLVVALIAVGVMRSKLKTVRPQAGASSYVRAGSMRLTQSSDLFLYRTVNRTAREKSSSSSGGSSSHTSSSGEVHGGGGGKF